jgi:hypothetical protein
VLSKVVMVEIVVLRSLSIARTELKVAWMWKLTCLFGKHGCGCCVTLVVAVFLKA